MRPFLRIAVLAAVAILGTACSNPGPDLTSTATSSPTSSPTPTTNGIEALPADEIVAKARAALAGSPSFRVKGSATVAIFQVTFEMVHVGDRVKGTQSSMGKVTEFVRIGQDLYVKAGSSFWSGIVNLESLALVTDKWVKVDPTSPNFSGLAPSADSYLADMGTVTSEGLTTLDGRPVTRLKASKDSSTIYVSAVGEPSLVRIEGTQSTEAGEAHAVVEFSDFGAVVESIERPTGEIVDISHG